MPVDSRGWLSGTRRTRRELLRAAGVAAGASVLGPLAIASRGHAAPSGITGPRTDIFIQVYSDYEETVRNQWVPLIEKALPVKVYVEPGVSADAVAKMRAERSSPKHHVMFMDSPIVAQAKREGLIAPLNKSVMPNLAEVYPEFILEGGYGVGIGSAAMGIATYTKAPRLTAWDDLWKPANKGKVSPPAFSLTNGVVFWIMAGAVRSGKTPQEAQHDPDACFAAMKALKPNISSFWTSDAQEMQLMNSGEVWYLGSANTKGTYTSRAKGLAIDWIEPKEGAFQLLNSGTVVKGSSNEKLAMQVLNMMVGQELQTILCTTIFVGPTNSKVKAPQKITSTKIPYGPAAVKRLIQVDWNWIQSQRDKWTERWNKEIAG